MMRDFGKNENTYRKRSSSKTPGKGNFIRCKLQNKQSPQSVHKLQGPQNPRLIFGSLVLIKRLFCISREIADQVLVNQMSS